MCATKPVRAYLRSKDIYFILREFHQQPKIDLGCSRTCEKIIQILIGDEDHQVDTDNFLELNIPSDLRDKFDDIYRKEAAEEEEEKKKELQ